MSYELKRPEWCPTITCQYNISSQNAICFGELPEPEDHAGIDNTHRMCMRGSPDDGAWIHSVQLNKSDGWNIYRLLKSVFSFTEKPE